jgi:putative DNA primase/helicase
MCALHHDGCLMLDEIKQIDPRIAENVVYMICNATGKSRMTRQITPRSSLSWRLLFLSSGELGLAEHVHTATSRAAPIKGGANVRLINIPADAGKGMGIFEDIHGSSDAASFAKELASSSKSYYGTALPAFLRSLMTDLDAAMDSVRDMMNQFTRDRNGLAQAAPEVHRALRRFALVAAAGELATRFGITGWGQGDAMWAATVCFEAWLKERGGSTSSDMDAAVRQVQAFVEAHGPGRFQPLRVEHNKYGDPIGQRVLNRAGFYRLDNELDKDLDKDEDLHKNEEGAREYLVLPECFRNEICANFDHKAVASELKKRGYLRDGNDRRHPYMRQVRTPDGPNPVWVYHLRSTIWSGPVTPATPNEDDSDVGHDPYQKG